MTEELASRMASVLGPSSLVLGNVDGQGDLEIRGRVQGNVAIEGRVHIADGGSVLGSIEAITITVGGTIRGDLTATDGVHVLASGTVEGNIAAPRVGIEAGARVQGSLRTGGARAATAERGGVRDRAAPEPNVAPVMATASGSARHDTVASNPARAASASSIQLEGSAERSERDEAGGRKRKRRRRRGGQGEARDDVRDDDAADDDALDGEEFSVSPEATRAPLARAGFERAPLERAPIDRATTLRVPTVSRQVIEPTPRTSASAEQLARGPARKPEETAQREPAPARRPDEPARKQEERKEKPARAEGAGRGPRLPTFQKGARGNLRDGSDR